MSMNTIMEREARLTILKELNAQPNKAISSEAMRQFLLDFLLIDKPRQWVELQFQYLADMQAVMIVDAGTVKIARLIERGKLHLAGKIEIDGVLSPSARGGD
ncbi:hypothetical protein [Agrobacterium tumefaciens]|uniref:hypothetical protein n=1 Tax=Agrobacterium tumefaciens TaxID=358 RepID=UPI0011464FFF